MRSRHSLGLVNCYADGPPSFCFFPGRYKMLDARDRKGRSLILPVRTLLSVTRADICCIFRTPSQEEKGERFVDMFQGPLAIVQR